MLFYFELIIIVSGMVIVSILPFHLFRKNFKESALVAFAGAAFLILHKNLILGKIGPFHDVKGLEYIFFAFKQYFENNIAVGWNPYMNAGEPFYLFSNAFLKLPWVVFILLNKIFHFASYHLFNLFWAFLFLNFCTGSLLLFQLLFEDFNVAFFCFLTLLFSNMFLINLGQPIGITSMYYLPWILFCILLFVKTKKNAPLFFALLFTAISINSSIPHINLLSLAFFSILIFIFHFKASFIRLMWGRLKSRPFLICSVALIAVLIASTVLVLLPEIKDFVSPHRGGGPLTEPNRSKEIIAFWLYNIVFVRQLYYLGDLHFAFYFGLLPLFLFLFAFVDFRNKYVWVFFLSFLFFLFSALGESFFGYRLLVKYLPTFRMIRMSWVFAQYACYFLICLSGFGLKVLLRKNWSLENRLAIMLLGSIVPLIACYVSMFFFTGAMYICLVVVFYISQNPKYLANDKWKHILYFVCLFFLLFDLLPWYYRITFKRTANYSTLEKFDYEKPKDFRKFSYPTERSLFPPASIHPLPPDFSSFAIKKASLTTATDDFIFFRNRYVNEMIMRLKGSKSYEKVLGVGVPLVYFADKVRLVRKATSEELIDEVYKVSGGIGPGKGVVFSEQDVDFGNFEDREGNIKKMHIEYTKIDNPNILEFTADIPGNGFIVRLDSFHKGWKAFVDGRKVRIYRANYAFQAIRVKPGRHKISFRFITIYPLLMNLHLLCGFFTVLAFNAFLRYKS